MVQEQTLFPPAPFGNPATGFLAAVRVRLFQTFLRTVKTDKTPGVLCACQQSNGMSVPYTGGPKRDTMETQIKHGVITTEHKNWNTKTVWNNGKVMAVYRHCPKVIHFQSAMVSDLNQHLCGGWHMNDIPDNNEAIIQQLVTGHKPLGIVPYLRNTREPTGEDVAKEKAVSALQRLKGAGLTAEMQLRSERGGKYQFYDVTACQNICVAEIGDLQALGLDYEPFGGINVEPYASRALSSFFGGWNVNDNPPWVTGLILGYPIENTISFMGY
jgi:hypothetical protein